MLFDTVEGEGAPPAAIAPDVDATSANNEAKTTPLIFPEIFILGPFPDLVDYVFKKHNTAENTPLQVFCNPVRKTILGSSPNFLRLGQLTNSLPPLCWGAFWQ
jgi:hypothetical protein